MPWGRLALLFPPLVCASAGSTCAASFAIEALSASRYCATARNGSTGLFCSASADATINAAIRALGPSGGTLALLPGAFVLAAPIEIDRDSVTLAGANEGGDLFFTAMGNGTAGLGQKAASTLYALGGFDAVRVGFGSALVFGVALRDFAVSGVTDGPGPPVPAPVYPRDAPLPEGAGVHVRQCDTVTLTHLQVRRKRYGVRFSKDAAQQLPWNVADVLALDGLYASYCGWALHVDGWLGNARVRNLWSYLGASGVLYKSGTVGQYDWDIADVLSQADGWNNSAQDPAPLYLATSQDLTLSRITINGLHDSWNPTARRGPIVQLVLNRFEYPKGTEAYRGHVRLNQATLFGSLHDAILVQGSGGHVDIRDLHVGSTGSQDFYGNVAPNVSGAVVRNAAFPGVDVHVDGGFAVSALADKTQWFVGAASVRNVRGYSPLGVVPAPFGNASCSGCGTLGPGGTAAQPAVGTRYTVTGVPVTLFVRGGSGVVLTVRDAAGSLAVDGLDAAPAGLQLQLGWTVEFAYAVPPSVRAVGW